MSLQYDEHRQYLADTPRLDAFQRAIAATVRPGDVVVDLGCGTGILGLLAARAGAARVYAIDGSGMIDLARQIAAANGLRDRIVHLPSSSMRVDLPEAVDVIVSDQMGRLGFEAGVIEFAADAARRWLKPGGRMIPGPIQTWIAPVASDALTAAVQFWRSTPMGFDVSPAVAGAVNTGYPAHLDAGMWLASPAPVLTCTPGAPGSEAIAGRARFIVERSGRLAGIGGWFVAALSPGVTMTNAPDAPDRIARRQAFLPVETVVDVRAGDVIDVTLRARPVEVVLAWDVVVSRGDAVLGRARHSTLAGMLVPRESLRHTDPARRPRLTPWAHARATVLQLCDGHHTLGDIERETAARHPDLFPDLASAATFVAEVVTRYGHTGPGA